MSEQTPRGEEHKDWMRPAPVETGVKEGDRLFIGIDRLLKDKWEEICSRELVKSMNLGVPIEELEERTKRGEKVVEGFSNTPIEDRLKLNDEMVKNSAYGAVRESIKNLPLTFDENRFLREYWDREEQDLERWDDDNEIKQLSWYLFLNGIVNHQKEKFDVSGETT